MGSSLRIAIAALLACTVAAIAASSASAARAIVCAGSFTNLTADALVVPPSGSCVLSDSAIAGNVSIGEGAYFRGVNSTIGGNLSAGNGATVSFFFLSVQKNVSTDGATVGGVFGPLTVHGNLSIANAPGPSFPDLPMAIDVDGNATFTGNAQDLFVVLRIGGNASFVDNSRLGFAFGNNFGGNTSFVGNTTVNLGGFFFTPLGQSEDSLVFSRNLDCSGNTQVNHPSVVPITVAGHASGQCAFLKP